MDKKVQIDRIRHLRELGTRSLENLATMQVSDGPQGLSTVNQLRIVERWMRMITIPNQSSVAKACPEFDEKDRIKSFTLL